eukprot:CAMPEP_0113709340 /NCGR_PEP_ID=MMETSP0038_2-20120614/29510_1 /TAXON_ID=2898 /ORGANISM="Cryptomonas paramecium" /LENGTH=36 /DNA_ID=CAMNT_0000635201 /DNA_START=132 /DNA_END=239 /DNA_ORIENTATION=+ /assembly_acc=CAM_ASM_000170
MQSTAASSIAAARPSNTLDGITYEADFDLHLDSVFD